MTSFKLEHSPGDYLRVKLLADLGSAELEKNNYKNAIDYLLEYFTIVKRNSFHDLKSLDGPCYFNLALSYSKTHQFSNSIKYWSAFLEGDQRLLFEYFENKEKALFDAFIERSNSYMKCEQYNEAIKDIDSALEIDPSKAFLLVNKGICYIGLCNKQDATKVFQKAKALGFPDIERYFDLCLPSQVQIEELSFNSFNDLLQKHNNQVKIREMAAEVYYLRKYFVFRKNRIITRQFPFIDDAALNVALCDLNESEISAAVLDAARKMFDNSWNDMKEILIFQFEIKDLNTSITELKNEVERYFNERHKI